MQDDTPHAGPPPVDSSFLVSAIIITTTGFAGFEAHLEGVIRYLRERYSFFEILLIGLDRADETMPGLVRTLGQISPQIRYLEVDSDADFDRMAIVGYQECIGDLVVVTSVEELSTAVFEPILNNLRDGKRLVRIRRRRGSILERFSSRVVRWITGLQADTRFYRTLGLSRQLLSELMAHPEEIHLFRFTAHALFGPQTVIQVDWKGGRGDLHQLLRRIDLVTRLVSTAAPRLLRLASAFCLGFAVLSIVALIYVILVWLFKSEVVEGWTTLTSLLALWMFVQSSALTVLCLGLSRMLDRQERGRTPRLISEMTVSDLFADVGMLNVESADLELSTNRL